MKSWVKKVGCIILATAVVVCTIPNQVYVYPGTVVSAEESSSMSERAAESISTQTTSEEGTDEGGTTSGEGTDEGGTTSGEGTDEEGTTSGEGTDEGGTTSGEGTDEEGTISGEGTGEGTTSGEGTDEGTTSGEGTDEGTTSGEGTDEAATGEESDSENQDIQPSIEVSLVDTAINKSSYVRDNDRDAYKTTITVNAVASCTKGDNTTDDDAKELLKNYAFFIDVSSQDVEDSLIDISYDSLSASKSFDVYTDGDVSAEISLVKKEDNTTHQMETASEVVAVTLPKPRVVLTSVNAEVADNFQYIKTDSGYQVEAMVSVNAQYKVENNTTPSAAAELLDQYTLYVTDNDGNQIASMKLSNDSISGGADTETVTYSLEKSYSVKFEADDETYAVKAEIKLDDEVQMEDESSEVAVLVPVIEVTNEIPTIVDEGSIFAENKYQAIKKVTGYISYKAKNATEDQIHAWLSDYTLVVQTYQKLADGSEQVIATQKQAVVDTQTSEMFANVVTDGIVYAKSWLVKKDCSEQMLTTESEIEVKIPKISIEASKPKITYHYSKGVGGLTAYATVSSEVSYSVANYIDDKAMAEMLKACNVKLEVRTKNLGIIKEPMEGDKGKDVGTISGECGSYTMKYKVRINNKTPLESKVIITIPDSNIIEDGEDVDIHIPKINIQKPTAQIWISDYQKNEDGIYEAEVSFEGNVAFVIEDFAPENADETWKQASKNLINEYRVQLVLKDKFGKAVVKTDYKSFENADKQDYNDKAITLNCDIELDLSQMIDKDDQLTAVYTIYHLENGVWKEIDTKNSDALTVGIPKVIIPANAVSTDIVSTYQYDKEKDVHSYDIDIDADVIYELVRGTADSVDGTIDALLADYKVRLALYNGEELLENQNITEKIFSQKDDNKAELSYHFSTTEDIEKLRVVVTAWHEVKEGCWEEVTLASYKPNTESIVIPSDIVLTSKMAPDISIEHKEAQCNHEGNNTALIHSHEIQVEGDVTLTFTGLSGLTLEQRKEEIDNRVAGTSMTVYEQLADTSVKCLTFDFADCEYQIVATEVADCYQVVVNVKDSFLAKKSGKHVYYTDVVANDAVVTYADNTHNVMIQELPQNFAFEAKNKEVVYAQDLAFKLTKQSDLYVGDFSSNCYKLTSDGKVLVNKERIVTIENNVVTINTEDVGEYYIEFTFAGNDIYKRTTYNTTFTVNKAPITTAFHVSSLEFTKSHELTMDVIMNAVKPVALKRYMEDRDIKVSFEAVPDNKQYPTVKLAEEEILFDNVTQTARVTAEIPHSISKKLVQKTTYTLRAEIQCGKEFPYTNEMVSDKDGGNIVLINEGFKVNNLDLVMSNDGVVMEHELAYEREYRKADATYDLSLDFYEVQNQNKPVSEPIQVTYTSSDKSIATVDENGIVSIHTAGTVYITVVADDATQDQNVYNRFEGCFKLTILSPADTRVELSVNGVTAEYANIQEIYKVADAYVTRNEKGTYWYDEKIVITIPEGSEYNRICYSINGGQEQITEGNTLIVKNELAADYQFYLIHDKALLNSLDSSADKGEYKKLTQVAVDTKAPAVEDVIRLTSEACKSKYSSDTLEYYCEEVQLTVKADSEQKKEQVFDYQSGVKTIEVQYGKDGKYIGSTQQDGVYVDDACYLDEFIFDFDALRHNYSTVKVIVIDNVGHKTEVVFTGTSQDNEPNYEGTKAVQICVDTKIPDLVVIGANADTVDAYEGEWTDEQVNYSLSVNEEEQVVSGIHAYQYAVLEKENTPEGGVDLSTLKWIEIPKDKLQVLFGIVEEEYDDRIQEGSFVYTSEDGTEILTKGETKKQELDEKQEEYKLNGTVYFRAISKSGLIGNVNKEIKIWQTEMDAPNVYANNQPAATGWYNKATGTVKLRFEYPDDYVQDKNAPAVGVWYTLVQEDENGQKTDSGLKKFMIDDVKLADGRYVGEATIDIPSDSINTLVVYNVDEAGNCSQRYQYTLNADYTLPEIENISYNGQSQKLYENSSYSDVVYTVFTQNSIDVTTEVTYGISQKKSLKLQQCKSLGEGSANGGSETESLSISANARGFIYATATDVAGNQAIAWANGYVADNLKPNHSQGIQISASAPNANDFYQGDVPLEISVSDVVGDEYSGLKSVTYSITCDGRSTKSGETLLSFPTSTPTWSQIEQYKELVTKEVVIDAAANEGNEVVVNVKAVDNALNETITEKSYMIDITNPVIDVKFDTDDAVNGTYYNKARTARIEITERNFEPSRVKFIIYKDGVEVNNLTPTNWITEEMTHTAVITFAEDGDYAFTVDCTDLADNEAEQVAVDEFTIDLTNPVVEVSYDQNTPWSGNYFNTVRTATITVTEHNFNEADFTAIVKPHVALSSWTHNADTHKATLSFMQDNHYTLTMNYTDMAGNEIEPFAMEDFYIDTQAPEISLSGVEEHSANAGTVIPVLTAEDMNYDPDGLDITLTDSTGVGYKVDRVVSALPNGYQYTLAGINGLEDQIYTLSAVLTDMAGNSSEISCRFSLNRNGSTYDLQEISSLVEKKYLRYVDMEDLHISEMNVDRIENFSIYMNKAGEVLTKSQEGMLPSKRESNVIYYDAEVIGNDETGYEYIYTLYRENFENEGIYNLMFYSKDRAGNEVNNTLTEKGAEITFVVDNTAPTVVIDGIEGGEFYAEEYRDVNVYVSDYTQLVEALFYLVDEDGVTVETYNYLELAENAGEVVTIRIPSNDKSLHLDYIARDIAGNEITSIMIDDGVVPTSFMITTNKWLQIRNNETVLTGIILGSAVVVIMIPVSVLYFRRRRIRK